MSAWDSGCRSRSEAFRRLLHVVSQTLRPECLDELKYQCRDHIGRGKLEKLGTFLELFTVLEERDIVSEENVEFLTLCLNSIYRKDLAKLTKQYTTNWLVLPYQSSHSQIEGKAFGDWDPNNDRPSKNFAPIDKVGEVTFSVQENVTKNESEALPFSTAGFIISDADDDDRIRGPLAPSVMDMIHYMANHLTHNWQATVRHLGVGDEVIAAANYNWPNDMKRQIAESLEFFARTGGNVSRESLIQAARNSGRVDIAEELQNFFP